MSHHDDVTSLSRPAHCGRRNEMDRELGRHSDSGQRLSDSSTGSLAKGFNDTSPLPGNLRPASLYSIPSPTSSPIDKAINACVSELLSISRREIAELTQSFERERALYVKLTENLEQRKRELETEVERLRSSTAPPSPVSRGPPSPAAGYSPPHVNGRGQIEYAAVAAAATPRYDPSEDFRLHHERIHQGQNVGQGQPSHHHPSSHHHSGHSARANAASRDWALMFERMNPLSKL